MSNEKINKYVDDTYDIKKKICPIFSIHIYLMNLNYFCSYGIEVNELIIVFWDISNF